MTGRTNVLQDFRGENLVVWRGFRGQATRFRDALPDLAPALDEYARSLRAAVAAVRSRGQRIILMTQPAIWREDLDPALIRLLWMGGVGEFQDHGGREYYTPGALRRAMDLYNRTMLEVCVELGVECIDLANLLPRDGSMFYDDVHLTEAGSRRIAEIVAEHLARGLPGDGPSAAGRHR
jgi:hypothetical protein